MFVNLVWSPNLANIPPCYVFLIQIIDGNCIFSHSLAKLANIVQDRKVEKHTPPSRGGLTDGTDDGTDGRTEDDDGDDGTDTDDMYVYIYIGSSYLASTVSRAVQVYTGLETIAPCGKV